MPDTQDNNNSNPTPTGISATKSEVPAQTPVPSPKTTNEDKPPIKIKYPPFFWNETQRIIKEIEQKTNSKVLVYYMYPGSMINNDDVDYFFSHIKDLQSGMPLVLVLVSNGGSGTAAWRIANVLKKYCNHLTVVVPSRCASAATLLSLSAEKILFGPAGYLTAIDTSLDHPLNPRQSERGRPVSISVDQIYRIKKFIDEDLKIHPSSKSLSEILFEKVHPIVLGELERTSKLSKLIAKNMIDLRANKPTEEEKEKIVDLLNDSYPTHGYPIVLKEAQQLGLPAEQLSEELSYLTWELIKLYSLISKKTITNVTPDFYHLEIVPVLIESVGKRTFFSESNDQRFKPPMGWVTENDKTAWLSSISDPNTPDKPKISSIEL